MNNDLTQDYEIKKPQKDPMKELFSWLRTIGITLVVAGVIITFIAQFVNVRGQSMEPTYHDGDRVLIFKPGNEYKLGDIVVINHVLKEPIIKRVIATEGQIVDFDQTNYEVIVDGKTIPGSTFNLENNQTIIENITGQMMNFPQTVPEGCVFVLGDNRMHSEDSRFHEIGMVPVEKIIGKVVLNVFPFDTFGFPN